MQPAPFDSTSPNLPFLAAHGGQIACEEDLVHRVFRNWDIHTARLAAHLLSSPTAAEAPAASPATNAAVIATAGPTQPPYVGALVSHQPEYQQQQQQQRLLQLKASDRGPLPQADAVEAANLPVAEREADVAGLPTGSVGSLVSGQWGWPSVLQSV